MKTTIRITLEFESTESSLSWYLLDCINFCVAEIRRWAAPVTLIGIEAIPDKNNWRIN